MQPIAGGAATQITHVNGFLHTVAFSPTEDRLVFEADEAGDELPHLFLTDAKGTAPKDIAADYPAGRRTEFVEWARDGKTFLFLSSLRDEKYLELCEYVVASGRVERLWEASGKRSFARASRDHKRFAIFEQSSDVNTDVYLAARGHANAPVLLTEARRRRDLSPADFSKDGKTLLVTSDEGGEFTGLYAMDLGKPGAAKKAIARPDWDIEDAAFSATSGTGLHGDERRRHAAARGRGRQDAQARRVTAGTRRGRRGFRSASRRPIATSPFAAERRLAGHPVHPRPEDGERAQGAQALPSTLRERRMRAVGSVVHVPSFDSRRLPAFLYRPEGTGPFPAIIDVHGGPRAVAARVQPHSPVPRVEGLRGARSERARLHGLRQDVHEARRPRLRRRPLQDVVACKKWLVANANVDASKVVVIGGSYGGYMALAAATFTPTEFAANIDYFGISDLKSLVESFPPYWAATAGYVYKKFGDPTSPADAKYQHDRSPVNFIDQVSRPLLVVQGDHDARVKKDQSDRIVAELQKRNVPVHYLVLANEGHGFSKAENNLAAYRATDRFLDRYVWGDTSADVIAESRGPTAAPECEERSSCERRA